MKKINILISAHEFSPYQGSECAVGWNLVTSLAKNKELNLFVLYASGSASAPNSYKDHIEKYQIENVIPENILLTPIDQPKITLAISKINRLMFKKMGSTGFPVLYYIGYSFWQKNAFKSAKKIIKTNHIDIVHNLTQISFREPGYLWKLKIPFIWGPMSGTTVLPASFLKDLPFKARVFEKIRNISNQYQFYLKYRVRKALKTARHIFVVSNDDLNKINKINKNVSNLLDTAASVDEQYEIRSFRKNEKLKIIWVGSLTNRKSLHILLHALAKIENVNKNVNLTVLGDGPLMKSSLELTNHLYLTCVRFVGKVPHHKVKSFLLESHVLIHTSYREAATAIIPESISTGLPIICHDISGMAIAVNNSCGIKIPLVDFDTSVNGFKKAIEKLVLERDLIKKFSEATIKRRKELTWEKSAEQISEEYHKLL